MRKGGLTSTYSFGSNGIDNGTGLGGDAIVLQPGTPAEDTDGGICEQKLAMHARLHRDVEIFRSLETSPRRMT
jgi:hypothetical protein